MFKFIRITILLLVLAFVSLSTWLTQARSTDWNNSLWVKVYPINADGSRAVADYIATLDVDHFAAIETFVSKEAERYGRSVARPVRVELGVPVTVQPPALPEVPSRLSIMAWSLKMRWWASSIGGDQDDIDPDVRIFVRYHDTKGAGLLENSVGLQKGMVGIVNAHAGRRFQGTNNVIIAHEFLHTLGATDKYDMGTGMPIAPHGLAEPERQPLYPQRLAEIMGGRIALANNDAVVPKSLKYAMIGPQTASEIRLSEH